MTLGFSEHRLDFRAVDQASDVCVGDKVAGQKEILLQCRGLGCRSVDGVQSGESSRGPDDEAAQVSTRSQLKQVQREYRGSLHSGDVAEGTYQMFTIGLGVVHDQGAAALTMSATSHLTLTGSELARLLHLDDIRACTNRLEECSSSRGLDQRGGFEDFAGDDEGDFADGGDAVASGEEEGGDGRGCDRGGSCEAPVRFVRHVHSEGKGCILSYFWPKLIF